MESRPPRTSWSAEHPIAKVVLFYAGLALFCLVLYQIEPKLPGVFSMERFREVMETSGSVFPGGGGGGGGDADHLELGPVDAAFETLITMIGSVLLMLPVAWVYILTRSKKGFSQSTVQTLIFLPIIVAGLIMLVRNSIALAFGLGGVVGAVAFRNRLQDPKDAIYIFLAIAVGLAAGAQALAVAVTISAFFNLVVLIAWRADFGRMPAGLESGLAERRLQRVKAASAGPQGKEFMSLVDSQLLKSMTPDQLQALSARAAERSREQAVEIGLDTGEFPTAAEPPKPKFDSMLRIMMQPDDAAAVRQAVEGILESQCKRWEFEKAGAGDGGRAMAQYKVKFKKSNPGTLVIEAMRRAVLPKVVTFDVRPLS